MPKTRKPRSGSLQFWPRVRSERPYARIRNWTGKGQSGKIVGFAGYKAGMTHVIVTDNRPNSLTKGAEVSFPVTVVECPPVYVLGIRLYKKDIYGMHVFKDILAKKDKFTFRRLDKTKKETDYKAAFEDAIKSSEITDARLIVQTKPSLTTIGKKKPEIFEIGLGGQIKEKLAVAKEKIGTEITLSDVFSEGDIIDSHAVTKGKGFQGPVKRFGVTLRSHKSEKTRRGPGSLSAWHPHHGNWYVAHAGQMGYHVRTEYNKQLLKIVSDTSFIPSGGFLKYGITKNPCMVVKGSLGGPAKRLIIFTIPIRSVKKKIEAPSITYISTKSHQGK